MKVFESLRRQIVLLTATEDFIKVFESTPRLLRMALQRNPALFA